MTGRERVIAALEHRETDRVPRYIWVDGGEATARVVERFGSYDAFLDHLDVDMFQAFPANSGIIDMAAALGENPGNPRAKGLSQGALTLEQALDAPTTSPNRDDIYEPIKEAIAHHQQGKGRAVFVQTPGCFETANGHIGMDAQLMEMALRPELMQELYRKQLAWTKVYIDNCLALGADVIHISDDLGQNERMLFSPTTFSDCMAPVMAEEAQYVRDRSAHLSLHSCGYFDDVIGDLADMGFDCMHPFQESAGMDLVSVKKRFGDRVTIYGGLDVRSTLPSGDRDLIRADVERIVPACKQGGGLIFCTGHTVHSDCALDDVLFAYELVDELGQY
ncbi:MAG TPA: uroporphyrinogen decarboxylase family protein [Armatimonadota bacterium]|nr:uroporphyrinogen decarboxylase family protein [Armatimonadota bacterium]